MEQTWTFHRSRELPEGPWRSEPDKVQWVDEATGLDCLAVRNTMGAWCGYVGLPPGHRRHGAGHDEVEASVHGGLTFAGPCQEDRGVEAVCHVPEPGRPADVWWLGFDCMHGGDLWPVALQVAVWADLPAREGSYRGLGYVRAECVRLAAQLSDG